jgi:HSP20 family molecular chaperone IbpA
MDVKETDKEISIEAELPGLDEKDLSLTMHATASPLIALYRCF